MAAHCSLVHVLEASWQPVLDAVLARRRLPTSAAVRALADAVSQMSAVYNAAGHSRGAPLAARVGFGFPRDVPKSAGAVRELAAAGLIAPEGKPLRIVDLGAGVGATTLGVVRALRRAGVARPIEATLVDTDDHALAAARELFAEAASRDLPCVRGLSIETRAGAVTATVSGAPDLVLLGQVLSELDPSLDPAERIARHAELLRSLVDGLAADGTLVVVEPALRDRTRHLHAVRDALLSGPSGVTVFAPCLHAAPCPALASEGDWCHEDLPVDLPEWLAPVARQAGLRFQGLTFSYLVLRKDGQSARALFGAGAGLRVISDAIRSKGKREAYVCGPLGGQAGARVRLRLLDRDESEGHAAWAALRRGDLLAMTSGGDAPAVDERGRIARSAKVTRVGR